MKKLIYSMLIAAFAMGGFWASAFLGISSAQASLRGPISQSILAEKRCEKCQKDPSTGKIVCKPVPCPN